MDPLRHASLSAKRRGGTPEDYYALHAFLDATKELCSDNRHRLLHNPWGIRRVVLPRFGPVLTHAGGARVLVKDLCEQDHVLADFRNRFVPTLGDFARAIAPDPGDERRLRDIRARYHGDDRVVELLLSPWAVTGRVEALLVTHNAWFLGEVLPALFPSVRREVVDAVRPDELFARMAFELWMDNGAALAPSCPRRGMEEATWPAT